MENDLDRTRVTITAWNVRAGLTPGKFEKLERLGADLMVVSELQPTYQALEGWSVALRTSEGSRVLGVLARPGWVISPVAYDPGLPWLLPLDVCGPSGQRLVLLALWTVAGKGRPSYPRQTQQAIAEWESACEAAGVAPWERTVLAGDFNASLQTTNAVGHRTTLQQLRERGLVSAYHQARGCEHGQEPEGTLRWVGRGSVVSDFHCDFVFASEDLASGLGALVGSFEQWCGPGLSDHVPVTASIGLPLAAQHVRT